MYFWISKSFEILFYIIIIILRKAILSNILVEYFQL